MATTESNPRIIRWLTYMMFLMFAMTTDAVGVIIPELMKDFDLGLTAAGLVHYGPMTAIALAGLGFGFLADRLGRKVTIILGLALFATVSFSFLLGDRFWYYLSLMIGAGLAIGIFKTAALALIGDISRSTREHTSTMNGVEAFFAIGAILGPSIVTVLLARGVDWKWLYVVAGLLCVLLILLAVLANYPGRKSLPQVEHADWRHTLVLLKDPYAMGFSMGAFLYVAVESAIYVWMPTFLLGYDGPAVFVATYALTLFFILRAAGRFLGMWLMSRFNWSLVLVICSGVIALCFVLSILFGRGAAVYLLPASGLFMSVIYPTLNSKGISCFEKGRHGTVAGVILFFTAAGAALGPLSMGLVSDLFGGDALYGFALACVFSVVLFAGLLANWLFEPVRAQLLAMERSQYS